MILLILYRDIILGYIILGLLFDYKMCNNKNRLIFYWV